uniref:Uncharacterized protein n=1 Tax=Ditylenchus dipsaci TaxID=166011 RepID=A0A915DQ96_9BILA
MSGCADPDSLDNLDFLFKVNFRSAIEMTLLAIPHLEKTKGNVVNVSSVSSVRSFAPVTYYSALKAALDHFTRNYAHKYGPKGIRFNTINPGPIATNIVQRHGTTDIEKEEVQKGFNQWAVETTALQRVGSTSEVSTLLKFLASSESSYITGASVLVDGGFNAVSMPMNFLG